MAPLWELVARSIVVAVLGVSLAAPFALYLGYRLARGTLRGGTLVETVLMLPLTPP